jgi:hypothetical protein
LEDLAFARQLRRAGRLTFLRTGLVTSARRWVANGVIKTTLVNLLVRSLFVLRIPPRRLRSLYDAWLTSGVARSDKSEIIPPNKRRLQGQR